MAEELAQSIIEYIRKEYLDEDSDLQINENTRLISGGIVDSFSMVSLKIYLEKKFQIQIPDQKATPEAFDSVTSIIALVRQFTKV
jgi:acyl carrier protein